MNEKKTNNFLKTAIAVLALSLLGLGFYTIQSYYGNKADVGVLKQEKIALKAELKSLLSNYEEAMTANTHFEKNLSEAKQKIRRLLDSIEKREATYVSMRKYKMRITSLKREKRALFQTIDSLEAANESLQHMVADTKTKLIKTEKRKDSLAIQNKKLVEKVAQLNVVNLDAKGVIVRNSGRLKDMDNASRVDKIEVCFSLSKNVLTTPGEKRLFIQIINPKNNLLGEKLSLSFGEAVLNYSKNLDVVYKNKRIDICTLVKAADKDLLKGRYIVNIFIGDEQLASTQFKLN